MCIRDRHKRIKFDRSIAVSTLIYASEAWVMAKKESSKIQSAEMQFLRNTLNYTLQDIITVSYTHLDVYKRQEEDWLDEFWLIGLKVGE